MGLRIKYQGREGRYKQVLYDCIRRSIDILDSNLLLRWVKAEDVYLYSTNPQTPSPTNHHPLKKNLKNSFLFYSSLSNPHPYQRTKPTQLYYAGKDQERMDLKSMKGGGEIII